MGLLATCYDVVSEQILTQEQAREGGEDGPDPADPGEGEAEGTEDDES